MAGGGTEQALGEHDEEWYGARLPSARVSMSGQFLNAVRAARQM